MTFSIASDVDALEGVEDTKSLKEPQDDGDHDHDVEDILDLAIHRKVGIYKI